MEIVKSKVKLTIFGKEYELSLPKAKKTAEFKKSITGIEDEVLVVESACNFLNECGLPKEITEELELEHLQQVIEFITSKKK